MATLAIQRKQKISNKHRLPYVLCSYCSRYWGPWDDSAIQPCPHCRRPMFLTRWLNPLARPGRVSGLLDVVDACQGVAVIGVIAALIAGWMSPRAVGQAIAMAMFVAASAHVSDGVLGLNTEIIRWFGKLHTGTTMRPIAWFRTAAGIAAFILSFGGILIFTH